MCSQIQTTTPSLSLLAATVHAAAIAFGRKIFPPYAPPNRFTEMFMLKFLDYLNLSKLIIIFSLEMT